MAGYSGTPLQQKLGIKPTHRIAVLDAPKNFEATLGTLPETVSLAKKLGGKAKRDVIVQFVTEKAVLKKELPLLMASLEENGGLWVAWPKKTSRVETDMTEDRVRELALPRGLVDNKVCAIDETWSGLRLVIRLENRRREPKAK